MYSILTKELIKHLSLTVPSRAPVNISTLPINSTSFSVTWQQVPLEHMNGIVLGYKISLENMDDGTEVSAETVLFNQTMTILRESEPTSRFCVRLLAFTSKGNGKRSDCVEGWTLSNGKSFNPELLLANFKQYIKHERTCLTTFPPRRGLKITNFEMFDTSSQLKLNLRKKLRDKIVKFYAY